MAPQKGIVLGQRKSGRRSLYRRGTIFRGYSWTRLRLHSETSSAMLLKSLVIAVAVESVTRISTAFSHVGAQGTVERSYRSLCVRSVSNWQIRTTLLDDEDNELATSARPAILPHTSGILKGVRMFFMWPLHLFGLKQEAETVLVSCINFYEVSPIHLRIR